MLPRCKNFNQKISTKELQLKNINQRTSNMLSHILKLPVIVLAFHAASTSSQKSASPLMSRRLTEYLLPNATTHEFARVPNTNFVLLSQMSSSQLLKIQLDPTTKAPIALKAFPMGSSSKSGLHGVWPSALYPGRMWLTLQNDNKLLLVDPGSDLATAPAIIQNVTIPAPGKGPHGVFELGNRVWAGLKDASPQTKQYYVFSANIANNIAKATDPKLYPCLNSPVFIVKDPATRLIYVTQDTASSIMSINITSGKMAQLRIPPQIGSTPVGMVTISSPSPKNMRGVWFTLAGNAKGGSGSFGRITSTGKLQFFQLKKPLLGTNAGLLHLADASSGPGDPALWLLSTSLLSTSSADALIRVTFDAAVTKIIGEEYIAMLSQNAMVHRVVPLDATVLVSELNTFSLAQLSYNNTVAGQWLPAKTIGTPELSTKDD